jgi:two-component system response regulator AtoC
MAANQPQALLAVRDTAYSAAVAQVLMQAGATVSMVQVRSAPHLLEQLAEQCPSLLVLELDREWSALEQLRSRHPLLPVVVLLTKPTEELAFAISRLGAEDVWTLPPQIESIAERAEAVVERVRAAVPPPGVDAYQISGDDDPLVESSAFAKPTALAGGDNVSPPLMTGQNPRMAEIRDTIQKVSGTDVTVLIRGESGVGKEVAARMLFEHSRRRQKPFIKVNCAAIPHDLLESELFGFEAGAFTGAVRGKPGKFELADHGTLFLDEIAEMHPSLQAKLLHVLQDGRFSRLGAKRDVSVDVRIICATNKLLEERVREGLFREDLLYRINVVTIFLPPLRERRDEIPVLTDYLLRKYSAQYGRVVHPLSA